MTHPLIDALLETPGSCPVTAETIDDFIAPRDSLNVLFFTGDPVKKLETADVAVISRELLRMFPGRLRIGVVDQACEKDLMGRAAVLMLPSLSFFHGGQQLETIAKVPDWKVYADKLDELFKQTGLTLAA